MAQAYMGIRLESTADKIARDPKALARAAGSVTEMRAGNSVDAFQALAALKKQRLKAKKRKNR